MMTPPISPAQFPLSFSSDQLTPLSPPRSFYSQLGNCFSSVFHIFNPYEIFSKENSSEIANIRLFQETEVTLQSLVIEEIFYRHIPLSFQENSLRTSPYQGIDEILKKINMLQHLAKLQKLKNLDDLRDLQTLESSIFSSLLSLSKKERLALKKKKNNPLFIERFLKFSKPDSSKNLSSSSAKECMNQLISPQLNSSFLQIYQAFQEKTDAILCVHALIDGLKIGSEINDVLTKICSFLPRFVVTISQVGASLIHKEMNRQDRISLIEMIHDVLSKKQLDLSGDLSRFIFDLYDHVAVELEKGNLLSLKKIHEYGECLINNQHILPTPSNEHPFFSQTSSLSNFARLNKLTIPFNSSSHMRENLFAAVISILNPFGEALNTEVLFHIFSILEGVESYHARMNILEILIDQEMKTYRILTTFTSSTIPLKERQSIIMMIQDVIQEVGEEALSNRVYLESYFSFRLEKGLEEKEGVAEDDWLFNFLSTSEYLIQSITPKENVKSANQSGEITLSLIDETSLFNLLLFVKNTYFNEKDAHKRTLFSVFEKLKKNLNKESISLLVNLIPQKRCAFSLLKAIAFYISYSNNNFRWIPDSGCVTDSPPSYRSSSGAKAPHSSRSEGSALFNAAINRVSSGNGCYSKESLQFTEREKNNLNELTAELTANTRFSFEIADQETEKGHLEIELERLEIEKIIQFYASLQTQEERQDFEKIILKIIRIISVILTEKKGGELSFGSFLEEMLNLIRAPYHYPRYGKKFLGRGTFGSVSKIYNQINNEYYALKTANSAKYLISLKNENEILTNIKCHDPDHQISIIRKIDWIVLNGKESLIMELARQDLWEGFVQKRSIIPSVSMIKVIARQLFEALAFLNDHSIVHADLTTTNIVFVCCSTTQVRVTDFGSSFYYPNPEKEPRQTRSYRSPECELRTHEYDFAIDMWSIGCVLAELFKKEILFPATSSLDLRRRQQERLGRFPTTLLEKSQEEKTEEWLALPSTSPTPPLFAEESGEWGGLIEIVRNILVLDPKKRISAKEVLLYPFFADKDEEIPSSEVREDE